MEQKILIKQSIKDNLPYGGLSKIAKLVSVKLGKKVGVSHVRNVCNPEMNSWDADIIECAQNLIIEENRAIIQASEKLL